MDFYTVIYSQLSKLDHKYSNRCAVNPKVFIADITKQINKLRLPSRVNYRIHPSGTPDGTISGLYVFELDYENQPCIFLCFGIPSNKIAYNNDWTLTKETISDTLEHEFCHMRQFKERDYEPKCMIYVPYDDLEYLSSIDEIEAYACNAARELLRTCKSYKEALGILYNSCLHSNKYSQVLTMYTEKLHKYPNVLKIFYRWVHVFLKRITKGTL